jgi:hypothetical protein
MPAAVFTDDHVGAAWNSQVRDAGTMCRWAFRDLARFAKGKATQLWEGLRDSMFDLAARAWRLADPRGAAPPAAGAAPNS